MKTQRIVISCFDLTANMVKPWADAGFLCYVVDIQHPPGQNRDGNIVRVGADMRDWLPPRGDIAFAAFFPPCTDVAVSGARWFQDKGIGALKLAVELFEVSVKLAEWCEAPYMIENPVSTISTYWRKPDHAFNPCDYGGYLPGGEMHTRRKPVCGQVAGSSCRRRARCNPRKAAKCTLSRLGLIAPISAVRHPMDLHARCLKRIQRGIRNCN